MDRRGVRSGHAAALYQRELDPVDDHDFPRRRSAAAEAPDTRPTELLPLLRAVPWPRVRRPRRLAAAARVAPPHDGGAGARAVEDRQKHDAAAAATRGRGRPAA